MTSPFHFFSQTRARLFARRLAPIVVFSAVLVMGASTYAQTVPSAMSESVRADRRSPVMAGVTFAPDQAVDARRFRPLMLGGSLANGSGAPSFAADGRSARSVGRALFQTTIINVFYEIANLVRGQVTAKITPKTWWANMKQGWVWDLDDFVVNQVGHPYQGNNYFNAGRANGLSFWESAAVTAFGSGTWEYFGETNHASLNDLINTTLGGIALGEMFHRTAWLVRNTHATGKGRLWNEIAATAIDPITGVNRFITGDSSRVTDKPADMVPSSLHGLGSLGALWRGDNTRAINAAGDPFLEIDVAYGDETTGRSRTPYDAFQVKLRFGGGGGFSEARVRGRLLGQPTRHHNVQFDISQAYDFNQNSAYQFGAQSFVASVIVTAKPSPRTALSFAGWGGPTALAAVDAVPLNQPAEAPPTEETEPSAGQGVSEGPRFYDYGPGSTFGARASAERGGVSATFVYEVHHVYTLDGVRANHFLQQLRFDFLMPLRGPLGLGVSGEYFDRRTFYHGEDTTVTFHFPQIRAFLTWRLQ